MTNADKFFYLDCGLLAERRWNTSNKERLITPSQYVKALRLFRAKGQYMSKNKDGRMTVYEIKGKNHLYRAYFYKSPSPFSHRDYLSVNIDKYAYPEL